MASIGVNLREAALTSFLVFGVISSPTFAGDLSRYRDFHFGADLPTVARLAGMNPTQAQAIHRRPVLIQNLEWRPQSTDWSTSTESAQNVVFSFYGGALFRIAVDYDRNETEGLTSDDLVEAVSVTYGIPTKYPVLAKVVLTPLGDQEQVLARWEDALYSFDLIRSSYGPGFRLVGVLRKVEAAAQASSLEAMRLDGLEAPQREAVRLATELEEAKARLGRARIVNKPKFRP